VRVEIGFCLPYAKSGLNRDILLEWCRRIDRGPFSAISCGERITGPEDTYDMRVLLSAAATVTERVAIMPTLYVLPMHSAVRAAQEIASLDVLSGGRVRVTVGYGGREKDYAAVGAAYKGRFQRMDEQVATMKRIWAGEPPFAGADPVGPRPLRAGGLPIYAGVMGPKSMARVARWADGVYGFSVIGQGADVEKVFAMADDAWATQGRAEKPHRIGGFWYTLTAKEPEQKLKEYAFNYLRGSTGDEVARMVADSLTLHTPEAVRTAIVEMRAAGCKELLLVPATADLAEIERIAELL